MANPKKKLRGISNSKIWNGGYGYVCNTVTNSADGSVIKYFICQDRLCGARAKTINGEYQVISGNHNHPSNDSQTKKYQFKQNLKILIQGSTMPVKDAYNSVASTDPTGALHCPMETLTSSMRRWRKEGTCVAPKPPTLTSLAECLESGSWKHISRNYDGPFYHGLVSAENKHALFFGNAKFISSTFKDSEELFIDVSYRLAPRDPLVHQLVTIFAVTNEKYIFPIAYILMEDDSEVLYKTAFSYFQTKMAPEMTPKFIICPCENKLNSALHSIYAYSDIQGSFFHYLKVIHCKARMLGITNHLDNDEVLAILMRYCTLPLLPYNVIQEAFDELRNIRPDMFVQLWNYVSSNWIEKVTIVQMCVFGQPYRTLALWIQYSFRLNHLCSENRPEMSKLIGELKQIHSLARSECKKLKEDKTIEKLVYQTDELFHKDLKKIWSDFAVGVITVAEMKSTISRLLDCEHSFFSFGVDDCVSMVDSIPNLTNTLFRPHPVQF